MGSGDVVGVALAVSGVTGRNPDHRRATSISHDPEDRAPEPPFVTESTTSTGFSAAILSTILGQAVELALSAGYMVPARHTSVAAAVGKVVVSAGDTFLVDGTEALLRRPGPGPRVAEDKQPGKADDRDDCQERPQDRGRHEGRSVIEAPVEPMP